MGATATGIIGKDRLIMPGMGNFGLGAIGIIGKGSLMTAVGNFDLSKETLNFVVNRNIKHMHRNDLLYILHAL